MAPLTAQTRKDVKFKWTPECQQAFDALKDAFCNGAGQDRAGYQGTRQCLGGDGDEVVVTRLRLRLGGARELLDVPGLTAGWGQKRRWGRGQGQEGRDRARTRDKGKRAGAGQGQETRARGPEPGRNKRPEVTGVF